MDVFPVHVHHLGLVEAESGDGAAAYAGVVLVQASVSSGHGYTMWIVTLAAAADDRVQSVMSITGLSQAPP